MQTTSDLYKAILQNSNHAKEIKLNIAGVEYGMGNIISCYTSGGIFSEPGIGNCTSRQIQLEIFPIEEIPRQAQIQIFVRLVLSEQISEWIPKGVFFISTREKNKLTGALKITGYDAMLKTEQTWLTADYATNVWPMSQADAVADIASRISVEIDSRTVLSTDYPVEYPTGENGDLTMREVLGYIATSNAGNWSITDDGKLRLIGYADTPAEDDKEALNKTNLGNHVSSLDYGEKISKISRINLVVDSNNMYTAGDDTGRTLEAACSWGTQAMANSILAKVSGVDYRPYAAVDALLDPAAEIGDGVSIADIYSVIATSSTTFGKMCEANISAPYTDEIDDEYPYKTPDQRKAERQLAQTRSLITKTSEEIKLEVQGLDGKYTKLSQTVDGFTFEDESGTTMISGSSIDTSTLNVQDINFTGVIQWSDLASDAQNAVNAAHDLAAEAYDLADSVQLPNYIKNTYIDAVTIRSPTIEANDIGLYGGYFEIYDSTGKEFYGSMGYGSGLTTAGDVTRGVVLSAAGNTDLGESGHYVIATEAGVRMQSGASKVYAVDGMAVLESHGNQIYVGPAGAYIKVGGVISSIGSGGGGTGGGGGNMSTAVYDPNGEVASAGGIAAFVRAVHGSGGGGSLSVTSVEKATTFASTTRLLAADTSCKEKV